MDLVYFGSGAFGLPTLRHLAVHQRVAAVVTQPDRPAGRGGSLTPTPIAQFAASELASVPIFKPEKVNTADVIAQIRALGVRTFVVIAFGQKIGRSLLEDVFAINRHASLLPRWRGAAPINAAILAGDPVTGNSVITLADRMDAGLVLAQSRRAITPLQTAGELHDLLASDGPALVSEVLDRHTRGALSPQAQDESLVTIAGKLAKADGWVDFAAPAEESRRRVHALTPWPGVGVHVRTAAGAPPEPLKLLRVQAVEARAQQSPGTFLDVNAGLVACAPGTALRVLEVQPAGKRAMPWPDYARGRRLAPDALFIGGKGSC